MGDELRAAAERYAEADSYSGVQCDCEGDLEWDRGAESARRGSWHCTTCDKNFPAHPAVVRAFLAGAAWHPADDGEAAGWRPIETAPKDGTHILMWRPSKAGAVVKEAWWQTDSPFGPGWGGHGWMYSTWLQPTHWMPLPPPPSDR
jgi:hypothetical protein